MNIAVNTRLLIEDKLEGIGWFTFETMKRITVQHPDHRFLFFFDRKPADCFMFSDNIKPIVIPPPARHPFLWYFWFEIAVPYHLKKNKADVFLSPDGFLSLSTNVPSISVIHDINFSHRPADLPVAARKFYNRYFPKYAHKAKRIVTVSNYSKRDIVETYKIRPDKIEVVYNGANDNFKPLDESVKHEIRKKYSNGNDYFIFVGALHPRKNIAGLLKAFDLFKKTDKTGTKLMIVGESMFKTEQMHAIYNQVESKKDIIFTGRLSQQELLKVFAAAYALTFVPFFEGFGIPMVEAMYCDVPIIASNLTSMPEVAGDAALYVNPYSIDSIKDAMNKMVTNKELRDSLIEKSRIRRKLFSWQASADKLWKIIQKTA